MSGDDGLILQALLRTLPQAIIVTDAEANVRLWNPAAERMLGWTEVEVLGSAIPAIPPGSSEACQELLDHWLRGHGLERTKMCLLQRDGTPLDTEVMPAPIFDSHGDAAGIILLIENLGERRRAVEGVQQLEQRLTKSEKLESLATLVGITAHDFNNLLMSIIGNANLALVKLDSDSPLRESIQLIEQTVMRAAELADQLLAISGQAQAGVQLLDLTAVVQEMAEVLRATISGRAVIQFDLANELPAVEADALQVRQVVMNLVSNAVEAIGDGAGVIRVITGLEGEEPDQVLETALSERLPVGVYAFIEISDSGAGIDAQTMLKIFEPFFTTKGQGRGLGLPAVMGIVRKHSGAIKVYSTPGHGSTFRVLFPSILQSEPSSLPELPYTPLGPVEGKTILVVDDEASVRSVVTAILQEFGFHVITANDGQQGVDIYRARADEIAAVLLDLMMPNMSGQDAFLEMRRIRPDARVILSSGYTEEEVAGHLLEKGLAGFIHKPYRMEELVNLINQVLDQG